MQRVLSIILSTTILNSNVQVPFLPPSVNIETTSEHNILATISDALKRADDPVNKHSLSEFYTRISASTGVGALSKFIPGLDEEGMSVSESKTGFPLMPSSSSCAGDINMKMKKGQLETTIGINNTIIGEQRAELQEVIEVNLKPRLNIMPPLVFPLDLSLIF